MTSPSSFDISILLGTGYLGDVDTIVSAARATEEAGFTGFFRSDHFLPYRQDPGPVLDAWTTLAVVARATCRLRIGTMVTPTRFAHPIALARQVCTVDHLSAGRVVLGLGMGGAPEDLVLLGPAPDAPGQALDRLAELIQVLDAAWAGQPIDLAGRYYSISAGRAVLPTPVQVPGPPVILGSRGGSGAQRLAVATGRELNLQAEPEIELTLRRCVQALTGVSELAARTRRPVPSVSAELRLPVDVDGVAPLLDRFRDVGLSGVMMVPPSVPDLPGYLVDVGQACAQWRS
jgi:alkanesulfonate monooxygenase SsuD/methylene tetrahydromethanopterin reductase-like flavin-dependent oxidoreductase (luciferase family)